MAIAPISQRSHIERCGRAAALEEALRSPLEEPQASRSVARALAARDGGVDGTSKASMPRSSRAAKLDTARRIRTGSSLETGEPDLRSCVDRAALDVAHPAAPVEDLAAIDVVKERVDGEIAPDGVFVGEVEDVVPLPG